MANLFGTTGDDALAGALDDDLLVGDLGNDVLQGLGGSDELVGDEGADTLDGGDGNDFIWAGKGDDSIIGGSGTDQAYYHSNGTDEGFATQGAVVDLALGIAIDGWGFTDTVVAVENVGGTSFDDILTGDMNANVLTGYDGRDTLSGGGGNDILYGGSDDNVLNGGDGADLLDGNDGNDTLHGDAGDDELAGGNGIDGLFGGAGDDGIWGAAGDDMIDGGDGYDIAYFHSDGFGSPAAGGVTVNLVNGTVVDGWGGTDTLVSIEEIVGTDFADSFTGNADSNVFHGIAGNDVARGGDGDDLLAGNDDADTLSGDAGDDDLVGGDGNDSLFGGLGNDSLWGGPGDDLIDGGEGYDIAYCPTDGLGGEVPDRVTINLLNNSIVYSSGATDTLVSIEEIVGTNFADTFTGNADSNVFYGIGGDDVISGGVALSSQSFDYLYGGAGSDTISFHRGFAFGGLGDDRISGRVTTSALAAAGVSFLDATSGIVANLTDSSHDGLAGGNAVNGFRVSDGLGGVDLISDLQVIFGSDFDDAFYIDSSWISGESNAIQVRTGEGDDTVDFVGVDGAALSYLEAGGGVRADLAAGTATDMVAGNRFVGDDTFTGVNTFYGSDVGDVINGSNDGETLGGNAGSDTIGGLGGDDDLFGDAGNDTLNGGTGNDWLEGGSGSDIMRGSAGNDAYIVDSSGDTIDEAASGSSGTDEVQSSISFSLNNSSRVLGNFEKLFLTGSVNINGTGNALDNTIVGNNGVNGLAGNAGNNSLNGNGGNDTLSGGTGNDWLEGGSGADILRGGAGNDAYIVDSSGDTIDEAASGSSGTDEVQSSVSFSLNNSSRVLGSFEKAVSDRQRQHQRRRQRARQHDCRQQWRQRLGRKCRQRFSKWQRR